MLKKLSIVVFSFCAITAFAAGEVPLKGPISVLRGTSTTVLPNDSLGRMMAWGLLGGSEAARNTVTALLTYCIAYTLYQTARGVGSTVWTWWKGETGETLSPALQRHVEIAVAEAVRRNGLGQMAIRRAPPHHDEGTCTCGNCCEARRVRQ